MTVFQVLAEVICAVELFGLIALAEFVDLGQMLGPGFPVCGVGEFLTTVAANVCRRGMPVGGVERCWDASDLEGRAGPRVSTEMQRVLVPLGLVLVLEAIRTVLALVLLFHRVETAALRVSHVFLEAKRRASARGGTGQGQVLL